MQNLSNIEKFPIIILSSPRTGSTSLGDFLSKKYNIVYYCEPNGNFLPIKEEYILKFHARDLKKYPSQIISKIFKNDCFLIRIRRRNLVSQIASNYVSLKRGRWNYKSDTVLEPESMEIDNDLVDISIKTVKIYNQHLETLIVNYDMDLYYEDIILDIQATDYVITPKPLFYDELKDIILNKLLMD